MKSLVLVLFALLWIRPPGPSVVVDDPSPYADSLMKDPQFTVLVVTITEATIVEGTRGAPPEGALRVEEVWRGKHIEPASYGYRQMTIRPQGEPEDGEWRDKPLHGPKAGDRVIVFTYVSTRPEPGSTLVLQGPQIRLTPETHEDVKGALFHDSPLLLPLFFIVALAPLLSLMKRSWLSLVVGLGAYLIYEGLMSPTYNIRIDLVILWPALAASALAPLVVGLLRKRREKRSQVP